jgi:hypothetical protein
MGKPIKTVVSECSISRVERRVFLGHGAWGRESEDRRQMADDRKRVFRISECGFNYEQSGVRR